MTQRERWSTTVGLSPHVVWVGERADKDDVVYLRWRATMNVDGADVRNWRWESLGVKLRTSKGRIDKAIQRQVEERAFAKYEMLIGKRAAPIERPKAAPLTLGNTWKLLIDPKKGKYPVDTMHRREVGRAMATACRIWGPETTWAEIDKGKLREIARTVVDELRARDHAGLRGAEIVVQRINAVATWLRDEGHIPADAAHPRSQWQLELREYLEHVSGALPAPERPRYSLEEMRKLLAAAWKVDPRCGFAVSLGAEQRLGQVVRAKRSDLQLEQALFRVPGAGKKQGAMIALTEGQVTAARDALAGYLRPLEALGGDYPLFPQGQLKGGRKGIPITVPDRHAKARSITETALRKWHLEAEELAEIPHVQGRGWYGLRRIAVDGAKELGISREGLQAAGGWSSTQMPDRIYADAEAVYARDEARDVRARVRGEPSSSGAGTEGA